MASNLQSRVIIGLCMDKERDEELLNFLSSQKNKSEYIRSLLYDHLSDLKNGIEAKDTDTHVILKDISMTLKNILFSLTTESSVNISAKTNIIQPKNIEYNSIPQSSASNLNHFEEEYSLDIKDGIEEYIEEDESDLILKAIAKSTQGF